MRLHAETVIARRHPQGMAVWTCRLIFEVFNRDCDSSFSPEYVILQVFKTHVPKACLDCHGVLIHHVAPCGTIVSLCSR